MIRTISTLIISLFLLLLFASDANASIVFTVSNAIVNQDQVEIDVSLSDATNTSCPDQTCYLQGMMKSSLSTRYFGFTKNNVDQ